MARKHKAKGYYDGDKKTIKILVERKDVDRDSPLQMRVAGRIIDIKLDEPIVVPEFITQALMDGGIRYTEIHDEEVPEEDPPMGSIYNKDPDPVTDEAPAITYNPSTPDETPKPDKEPKKAGVPLSH